MLSALGSSVSGIKAQDEQIVSIGGNIANAFTKGYKGVNTAFSTLVNNDYGGGVLTHPRPRVSVAGFIDSTDIPTDLAIQGNGMFVVNTDIDGKGEYLFSREGSFRADKFGNLINVGGGYLMAWPVLGDESLNATSELKVVNLQSVATSAVATKKVNMTLNLDASTEIAKGKSYQIKADTGYGTDDVIHDTKLQRGDGISFDYNGVKHFVKYDGFTASNKINDFSILGASLSTQQFTCLQDGNWFSLNVDGKSFQFVYRQLLPNTNDKQFNDMNTLAEAINKTGSIIASVNQGVLSLAPKNISSAVSFSNGMSPTTIGVSAMNISSIHGVRQIYDSKSSVDITANPVYSVNTNNAVFGAGANVGDALVVITDAGKKYRFIFNNVHPNTSIGEFATLQDLSDAINHVADLEASVSGGILTISGKTGTNVKIISILDHDASSTSGSKFATTLGLYFDTDLRSNFTAGDGVKIAYGNFSTVVSDDSAVPIYKSGATFGKTVSTKNISTGIFGATTPVDKFHTGIKSGDGLSIVTDQGNATLKFASGAGVGLFDSLETLKDAINNTGICTASIANGILSIQPSGVSTQIYSVTNFDIGGSAPSKVADALGINYSGPRIGDSLNIELGNGVAFSFKFTGTSSGQGVNGIPATEKGEFNDTDTLVKSINYITNGQISASITGGHLSLQVTGKALAKIGKITSDGDRLTSFLGNIGLSSGELSLRFVDKFITGNSPTVATLPNTKAGEFNDINTFVRAINESSKGALGAVVAGGTLRINVNSGGAITYIADDNMKNKSNIATTFGIKAYNIPEALNFHDIVHDKERFARISDILPFVNDAYSGNTLASMQDGDLMLSLPNVLDKFDIKNQASDASTVPVIGSDFLTAFGLVIDPKATYDPEDDTRNLASGSIKPHFNSNLLQVYDSLGIKHGITTSYIKTGINTWSMEIYAAEPHDVVNSRKDGLLGHATLSFNGFGKLTNAAFVNIGDGSPDMSANDTIQIKWHGGANSSAIHFDFGLNASKSDEKSSNIKQSDGEYAFIINADGTSVGELKSVTVDKYGVMSAVFTNGDTKDIYRIPLSNFTNIDGLTALNGNLYEESAASGKRNINSPNHGGLGVIIGKSLESSNVEMLDELSKLIPTQQGYQANVKIIQTINRMFDALERIFG